MRLKGFKYEVNKQSNSIQLLIQSKLFTLFLFIEFIMASTLNQGQRNATFFDCNDSQDKRASFIFTNIIKLPIDQKKINEDIQLQQKKSNQLSLNRIQAPQYSVHQLKQHKIQNPKQNSINQSRAINDSRHRQQRQHILSLIPTNLSIQKSSTILNNAQKSRMIREINLKIQLLQSKSRQPGICLQDLRPIREEIYNKFDQYYITNRQIRSRFVDKDNHDSLKERDLSRPSRIRNESREKQIGEFKSESKTSSPQSSSSRQFSLKSKNIRLNYQQKNQRVNYKTYRTMANISVVSNTNQSNNQEQNERPLIETELTQKEFQDLDRQPERKMSAQQQEEQHHQSYIQLKENVRIMEQRIVFLIYRLQQNRKQINNLKESKEYLQKSYNQLLKKQQNLMQANGQLENNLQKLHQQNTVLKISFQNFTKDKKKHQNEIDSLETKVSLLKSELQFSSNKLTVKQNQLSSLQDIFVQKKLQCQQFALNLRILQKDFAKRRKQFRKDLSDIQIERDELKAQLRQHKARMQVEGITFKYEEAAKLKSYIEDNELLHLRQIEKLDSSYSQALNKLKDQNRKLRNEKIQLQNILVQYIGKPEQANQQVKFSKLSSHFQSQIIQLNAVQLRIDDYSDDKLSTTLSDLLQKYRNLLNDKRQLISDNIELQHDKMSLKIDYEQELVKAKEQIIKLENKLNKLSTFNHQLHEQKICINNELEIVQAKLQQLSNQYAKTINKRLQSNIFNISYPQPLIASIGNGTKFMDILKKLINISFKRKLQIVLKLIDLSLSCTGKKFPTINPACLKVQFSNLSKTDFSLEFNLETKQQEQNLYFCSPEVLLGFHENHQSHCWTIGVIFDKMLHGKEYFTQYSEIVSRKENYIVRDEKYKSFEFLSQMMMKNHRQRITLSQVRRKIIELFSITTLQ